MAFKYCEMNRQDHLAWCKSRAIEYCDANDPQQAYASMASDLNKHDETRNHSAIEFGMMQLMAGLLQTPQEMRKFIEGFN